MSKIDAIKRFDKEGTGIIRRALAEKLSSARQSPQIIGLLAVEFLLILVLVIGLYVYIDPEISLLPAGTPNYLNYLGFIIILAGVVYVYKLMLPMHFPSQIGKKRPVKSLASLYRKKPKAKAIAKIPKAKKQGKGKAKNKSNATKKALIE